MEKASLLNTIARGMQGEENIQGGLINNLLTENALENIAENTWNNIIQKLIKFGSISSAIIMTIIIINIGKILIDTVIRGYTLYTIYGWSVRILAAIFSSITHLLILAKKEANKEDTELREIKIETRIRRKSIGPPLPPRPPNTNFPPDQKKRNHIKIQ